MSNKVEIVKIIGALRARDLPALFYLYTSETTEVHHIAWLPRASPIDPNGVITLLENGPHFMSN